MIILLPTRYLQFGGAAYSKLPMIQAPTPLPFNPGSYVIGYRKGMKECDEKVAVLNQKIEKLKKTLPPSKGPYVKDIHLKGLSKDVLRDLVFKSKKEGLSAMEKVSLASKQQLYNELLSIGFKE